MGFHSAVAFHRATVIATQSLPLRLEPVDLRSGAAPCGVRLAKTAGDVPSFAVQLVVAHVFTNTLTTQSLVYQRRNGSWETRRR